MALFDRAVASVEAMLAALRADAAPAEALAALAEACVRCLGAGGKLLLAGNGGSAADAQHWAAELVGRFQRERRALAAVALTTDTSALTAIGNDYGYAHVFARQLEALGRAGDVFIGISTSGNSANVVQALQTARARGLVTAGFTGAAAGAMAAWCDHLVRVPASSTPVVQQGHALLGHVLCEAIETALLATPLGAASG